MAQYPGEDRGYSVNKGAVLVPATVTEHHSLGDLDNRHVYFAVLKFKIKVLEGPHPFQKLMGRLLPFLFQRLVVPGIP